MRDPRCDVKSMARMLCWMPLNDDPKTIHARDRVKLSILGVQSLPMPAASNNIGRLIANDALLRRSSDGACTETNTPERKRASAAHHRAPMIWNVDAERTD